MFLEIENNPNFDGSYFVRFKELGPPRLLTHVKSYERMSRGEWCEVTGWCDDPDQPLCPVYAQKVEDSGAGLAFITFDITDMIGMLCPAKIRFTEFMVLNHRPHGSI